MTSCLSTPGTSQYIININHCIYLIEVKKKLHLLGRRLALDT